MSDRRVLAAISLIGLGLMTACAPMRIAQRTAPAQAPSVFHVSVDGDDRGPGTRSNPFRTISAAAQLAQPGDTITVHRGVYRERVDPPCGGTSDRERITYQVAPGELAEIRGSEVIKAWHRAQNDTWKVVIPNSFFGSFNPYSDLIRGDWFASMGRQHHTGAIYLDGEALVEAIRLEDVLEPVGAAPLWIGRVEGDSTTIWAQFNGVDPNSRLVEINARRAVFYPEKPGMHYITVRGFVMRHAATPWAPPTAEQIGLIGTHWSKGWIIENNVISHSRNTCVTLGKYGDEWDNKAGSAQGYVGTINRAIARGWSGETVGHHLVQNNVISHCGQAGIVGSLGAIFSTITDNEIHDIHVRPLYSGAEMAGIKLHGAIDVTISQNHIYRSVMGIWLDWMTQGTRVERNLLHDNREQDLWVEVNHGPYLVDNNVFLSRVALQDWSQGGAFAHNLIAGRIDLELPQTRQTPYFRPHSTDLVALSSIPGGDMRFHNNAFARADALRGYVERGLAIDTAGNMIMDGGIASLNLTQAGGEVLLEIAPQTSWNVPRSVVTTASLGKARVPGQAFENPDGSPLRIDTDYFGKPRSQTNPSPGPFELSGTGRVVLKVWPR